MLHEASVPTEATIHGWIEEVAGQGIRRPGYPADRWAEAWCQDRFRALGLERVRAEPVAASRWEPTAWSLVVTDPEGVTTELDCYPVPFSCPVDGLEVELVRFDTDDPAVVAGRGSFTELVLLRVPADLFVRGGSAPADLTGRVVDRDASLGDVQVLPFGPMFQEVLEPSIAAGAALFVGALSGYPGDSCRYFVPYDGIARSLPGVWINGSDGAWLAAQLDAGTVVVRLSVHSAIAPIETYNIVGELPGADDEVVMIGSHHDGPWASAVEDGSGIALVLAQAAYWSAQPVESRPHRLVFVLHGGHMSGGAGLHAYIDAHRNELAQVVLELHLEHAAQEFAEHGGTLVDAGRPVPRWWFTSRIPSLEEAVSRSLHDEGLWRSMVLAPDAIGPQPPTDGGFYHQEGVPIVNFLAAPFYLFDEMDTLDKVDRAGLVPLTRAAIRLVDFTRGRSAGSMRGETLPGTPQAP